MTWAFAVPTASTVAFAIVMIGGGCGDPSIGNSLREWGVVGRLSRAAERELVWLARSVPLWDTGSFRGETGDHDAVLGVASLISGDHNAAVAALLDRATDRESAEALSDVAVAYLTRSQSPAVTAGLEDYRESFDLLRALDFARRASMADPAMPEAGFNLAMAQTLLGLRNSASQAWEKYLELDSSSTWSKEARSHLEEVRRPVREDRWPEARADLLAGGDAADVVAEFPFRTRRLAEEELLPRWAATSLAGSAEASRLRKQLVELAESLLVQRGEGLLHDTLAVLGNLPPRAESTDTLREVEEFGEGMRLYRAGDTDGARQLLSSVAVELEKLGIPLGHWARFFASICEYYDDVAAAGKLLVQLEGTTDPEVWPALGGRIQWMLGTIDVVQERLDSAVRRYRKAHELLQRSSGAAQSAFVDALLASAESNRGRDAAAWRHRLRALRNVPLYSVARRVDATLMEAQDALMQQGMAQLAEPFADEQVLEVRKADDALGLAQAYVDRAEVRATLGRPEEALQDLSVARQQIRRMPVGALAEEMNRQADLAAGLTMVAKDSDYAIDLLNDALERQVDTGYLYDQIKALVALARSRRLQGQPFLAAENLHEAQAVLLQRRLEVPEPLERVGVLNRVHPIDDQLLQLRLDGKPTPQDWFWLSEDARARALQDLADLRGPSNRPTLHRVQSRLDDGSLLLHYTTLPDEVVLLAVDRHSAVFHRLPVTKFELAQTAEALIEEIESQAAGPRLRARLGALYEQLLRPAEDSFSGRKRLIVIPDGPIEQVPFAALWREDRRRFLIEDLAVQEAPKVSLAWHTEESRHLTSSRPRRVLVAYYGTASNIASRPLPRLDFVDEEARKVAEAYPAAVVLSGEDHRPADLKTAVANVDVLHFAGHAIPGEIIGDESLLVFGANDASVLHFEDLRPGLPAELRLVVLSACRTVRRLSATREGGFGLAGVLSAAGIPTVVASRWSANDRETMELMAAFHREYAETGRAAESLRTAIVDLRESGVLDRVATWANFTVIEPL